MPLGSCHSDYNPLLSGQEPNLPRCEVPGSTCPLPHSCLTLAFWALAHFQFLDCAVLSPIGLFSSVLQLLMLPPIYPIKRISPLPQLKHPFFRGSLLLPYPLPIPPSLTRSFAICSQKIMPLSFRTLILTYSHTFTD